MLKHYFIVSSISSFVWHMMESKTKQFFFNKQMQRTVAPCKKLAFILGSSAIHWSPSMRNKTSIKENTISFSFVNDVQ